MCASLGGSGFHKVVLDGALFIAARARRARHGRSGSQALGHCFWAATVLEDVRGAPRPWRPWSGGARRAATRPCISALGAPRVTIPNELTEGCLRGWSAPPNGSRLSCGRNARRRKALERQTKRLASEGTQFFPQERPAASSAC